MLLITIGGQTMKNIEVPFLLIIIDSHGNILFSDQEIQKDLQHGDSIFHFIQTDMLPIHSSCFLTARGLLILYPISMPLFTGYYGFLFNKGPYDEAFNHLIENITELEAIFNFSHDGIVVANSQGTLIRVNKNYEKITGIPAKEVIGNNLKQIVSRGIISESATVHVLETKKEITLQQKFRTGFESIVTAVPVFDENHNIFRVITNLRDTTEINKLREQLIITERQRDSYSQIVESLTEKQVLTFENLIFCSSKMHTLVKNALKFAKIDSPLLITGESGTGKEVMADIIYKNSSRRDAPFLKINCSAIPETLLESELFGYEGGAFTGAKKEGRTGLFELANTGTVLLDEIGELSLPLQIKLLRFVENKEFFRIGGKKTIHVDVRIIAATNRNIEEMVKNEQFRLDLFLSSECPTPNYSRFKGKERGHYSANRSLSVQIQ